MKKKKLNVEAFLLAAQMIESYDEIFSCNALKRVLENQFCVKDIDNSPELKFYHALFDIRYSCRGISETFWEVMKREGILLKREGILLDGQIDLHEIRVWALCFAAEIARLKNQKK